MPHEPLPAAARPAGTITLTEPAHETHAAVQGSERAGTTCRTRAVSIPGSGRARVHGPHVRRQSRSARVLTAPAIRLAGGGPREPASGGLKGRSPSPVGVMRPGRDTANATRHGGGDSKREAPSSRNATGRSRCVSRIAVARRPSGDHHAAARVSSGAIARTGRRACSIGVDDEGPIWPWRGVPYHGWGQAAKATRGRDLLRNVPFPRKPPDLLMAESPR
jgi:hypothetical protein